MDKTFNELFDDFFKRNNIKPEDKIDDDVKEKAKKMIDMLTNSKDVSDISEEVEKEMDLKLGKPDKIEFFNEGNIFFERRTWHTADGDIQKLIYSNDPTLIVAPQPKKPLADQLAEAVEAEQFEKAAAIRDEIKKSKRKTKKTK